MSRKRTLLLFLVGLTICVAIAFAILYREHIAWKLNAPSKLSNVASMPIQPMPLVSPDLGWTDCRNGSVAIKLPENMASKGSADAVAYASNNLNIIFTKPVESREFIRAVGKMAPQSVKQRLSSLSVPELKVEAYRVDARDFSWHLDSDEVQWHAFLVNLSRLLRADSTGLIETYSRDDLRGVLHFYDETALFTWQFKNGAYGTIRFTEREKGRLNHVFVRAVCQSLHRTPDSASP